MQPDGIPLADAAERLGVSREALRKRITRGRVSGFKAGGRWFVRLPVVFPRHPHHEREDHLPRPLTSFIGREMEIAELRGALPGVRLLTLTGAGGCGKTRLALELAHETAPDFADRARFVDLGPLSDPALIPQTVAAALGLREGNGESPLEQLKTALQRLELLLLLDNCEHLLPACATFVEQILAASVRVRILATSREPLGVAGETVWQVPPMSVEGFAFPALRGITAMSKRGQADAVRLFAARAHERLRHFTLTAENVATVEELCRRLDGLPLAIELAAARVALLSVGQIVERLNHRFRLLTGGSRSAPQRQQTLRAAVVWSYHLLDDQERAVFDRLSIFPGTFEMDAAEAVCAGGVIAPEEVLDLLGRLVEKSLVSVEAIADPARYRLLETLREFGRERLAATGEEDATARRMADHALTLAERAEPEMEGADQARWLERLAVDHDLLRAGLRRFGEAGETGHYLRLAGALWRFWWIRGFLSEGRGWLAIGEAAGARVPPAVRAKALIGLGMLAKEQGDYGAARHALEAALHLHEERGDQRGRAVVLNDLGMVAQDQGEYGTARTLYEESLELFRALGDRQGAALRVGNLGLIARLQGDLISARALQEESLALLREVGHTQGIANSLLNLAAVRLLEGDRTVSRALLEESLTLSRELGNRSGVALRLFSLGYLLRGDGALDESMHLLREGLSIAEEIGDKRAIADHLGLLGLVAADQGLSERAARLLGAADTLRTAIGATAIREVQAEQDAVREALRGAMGDEAFAAAWAAGGTIPLSDAILVALEEGAGTYRSPRDTSRPTDSTRTDESRQAGDEARPVSPIPSSVMQSEQSLRPLTSREAEVLRLLADGHSNKEIAAALRLSVRTVERHLLNIYQKIDARGRADAIAYALRRGVSLPSSWTG